MRWSLAIDYAVSDKNADYTAVEVRHLKHRDVCPEATAFHVYAAALPKNPYICHSFWPETSNCPELKSP